MDVHRSWHDKSNRIRRSKRSLEKNKAPLVDADRSDPIDYLSTKNSVDLYHSPCFVSSVSLWSFSPLWPIHPKVRLGRFKRRKSRLFSSSSSCVELFLRGMFAVGLWRKPQKLSLRIPQRQNRMWNMRMPRTVQTDRRSNCSLDFDARHRLSLLLAAALGSSVRRTRRMFSWKICQRTIRRQMPPWHRKTRGERQKTQTQQSEESMRNAQDSRSMQTNRSSIFLWREEKVMWTFQLWWMPRQWK